MPLPELLALTGLGVLTGAYGVIVGAGVGFLLAPLLILGWGMEPGTAVGTSLAVVLVTAVSGSLRYARSRSIDYRSGILFAVAALPGSILGAVAADWAPGRLLTVAFGLLLISIAAYTALRPASRPAPPPTPRQASTKGLAVRTMTTASGATYTFSFSERRAMAYNVLFGFLSSFFGVGGGLVRVPLLVFGFRFPVPVAAATSLFSMALYTGVGVASHAVLGNVEVQALLFAGAGVIVGAQIGVPLAPRLRGGLVLRLLAGGLAFSGGWLILRGAELL